MPQIIRDTKQEQALELIGTYLAEITKINAVISSGDYNFTLQSNGGKKAKLDIAPAQNDRIVSVLKERKKDLAKEAKAVAKANRIAFDSKELTAMSDDGHKSDASEKSAANAAETKASHQEKNYDRFDLL